jgi:hypothetical protein
VKERKKVSADFHISVTRRSGKEALAEQAEEPLPDRK